MKLLILVPVLVLISHCSTGPSTLRNSGDHKSPTLAIFVDNRQNSDTPQCGIPGAENFTVDEYEDSKLVRRLYFRKGLLIKAIGYNIETANQENEAEYFYTNDREFSRVEVKSEDESKEANLEANKMARDFLVQYRFLRSKEIEFPLPDIVTAEVDDISRIFSVASDSNEVKRETHNREHRKIIKFIRLNKTIRFEPSIITLVVGNNPIHVVGYEMILENTYPLKELLTTGTGQLIKTYFYQNGRLVRLIYEFINEASHASILEKRFEYCELK